MQKTNAFSQRLCVVAGPLMALTFLTAFLIMGFIPPPDPKLSGEQIVELFSSDQGRIRTGGVVMLFGSALLFPWISVISVQLRRIEGRHTPMSSTQLTSGALGAFLFLTPMDLPVVVPLSFFGLWMTVMATLLWQAIDKQAAAERTAAAVQAPNLQMQ